MNAKLLFDVVTFSYGPSVVLNEFSLSFGNSEFVALLGPSGCGKTTILKLAAGLLEPKDGEVLKNGIPTVSVAPASRLTGLVFQDYALFPNLTVNQNIAFGLAYSGIPKREYRKIVERLTTELGLTKVQESKPRELSGGEAQRAALARAIAPNPDILLLDEPFSNLDRTISEAARQLVGNIHEHGQFTTILVTHDWGHALRLADRIVVLSSTAEVLQDASPHEVYTHPASPVVARLSGPSLSLRCTVKAVASQQATLEYGPNALLATLSNSYSPKVGSPVLAMTRPEFMHVTTKDEGIMCHVENARTLGAHILYSLRSSEGDCFEVQRDASSTAPKVGSSCRLSIDPDRLICFKEDIVP